MSLKEGSQTLRGAFWGEFILERFSLWFSTLCGIANNLIGGTHKTTKHLKKQKPPKLPEFKTELTAFTFHRLLCGQLLQIQDYFQTSGYIFLVDEDPGSLRALAETHFLHDLHDTYFYSVSETGLLGVLVQNIRFRFFSSLLGSTLN